MMGDMRGSDGIAQSGTGHQGQHRAEDTVARAAVRSHVNKSGRGKHAAPKVEGGDRK